jgi:hypothetical protein
MIAASDGARLVGYARVSTQAKTYRSKSMLF